MKSNYGFSSFKEEMSKESLFELLIIVLTIFIKIWGKLYNTFIKLKY